MSLILIARNITPTESKEEPWNNTTVNGEKPGDICCKRSLAGRCYAHNKDNYNIPKRQDGTSDYDVEVSINQKSYIWVGKIENHIREEGAAKLLRLIADKIDEHKANNR